MRLGKVSDSVLKRSVLKQVKTKRSEVKSGAAVGADCAVFAPLSGGLATCVREAAVASGRDMGCAVYRCAGNLAAAGAEPIAVLLTLLLPERTSEQELKELMAAAETACGELHMQIAGGHTTVSPYAAEKLAVITGYGRVAADRDFSVRNIRPGQDIVITKWIGLAGTAALAKLQEQALLSRYPAYLVEEAAGFDRFLNVLPEAALATRSDICDICKVSAVHDVSEGGIFGALWELAEGAGVGLTVDLKKIPIRQETVEVCEFCGVNPYLLDSGGCLLITAEDGDALADALEAAHIPAVIVGRTTDSHDRILTNEDEVRYLDKPQMDEWFRLRK